MRRLRSLTAIVAGAALLIVGGCPISGGTDRTSDQGGGSLVSAGTKIAQDRICDLNADEIQLMTDAVLERKPEAFEPLTNDQAQAVVDFVEANDACTLAAIQQLALRAEQDPDSIIIPDSALPFLESIGVELP